MLQSSDDVLRYAGFLREEADLTDTPPIDLLRILDHFGIPEPRYAPLPGQQAMLLDQDTGLVLINEDDPETRRRFSQGHELIEMLFAAHEECLANGQRGIYFPNSKKEVTAQPYIAAL